MSLSTAPYQDQLRRWPPLGRKILAQHDGETIVVYQTTDPETARAAVRRGRFESLNLGRPIWIRPSFLLTMHRSGWGAEPGQEATLAVRIGRPGFDALLRTGVPMEYDERLFADKEKWRRAFLDADIRFQWDSDRDPGGASFPRKAIEISLRNRALRAYCARWTLGVLDITRYVAGQRAAAEKPDFRGLQTPIETVYSVPDAAAARVGMA